MGLTLVDFGRALLQIIKVVILVITGVIMVGVKTKSVDQSVELLLRDGIYIYIILFFLFTAFLIHPHSSDYLT